MLKKTLVRLRNNVIKTNDRNHVKPLNAHNVPELFNSIIKDICAPSVMMFVMLSVLTYPPAYDTVHNSSHESNLDEHSDPLNSKPNQLK